MRAETRRQWMTQFFCHSEHPRMTIKAPWVLMWGITDHFQNSGEFTNAEAINNDNVNEHVSLNFPLSTT